MQASRLNIFNDQYLTRGDPFQCTNVLELYCKLREDDSTQMVYYDSGLGTAASSSTARKLWVDNYDQRNIRETVIRAYTWLCNYYTEQSDKADCIYLFVFSRGAYQVRMLAGMIQTVGLLCPGNHSEIPLAYEFYINGGKVRQAMFKATCSQKHAKVHFLGVWDTVAALNVHKNPPPLVLGDFDHVCYVRHALALDETRALFLHLPISDRPRPSGPPDLKPQDLETHVKEVWFAGSHSQVGGGHIQNIELDSGNISLHWMRQEAQLAGINASTSNLRMQLEALTGLPKEQLKGKGGIFQLFFYNHPKRQVRDDQEIHSSVLSMPSEYKPKASVPPNRSIKLKEIIVPMAYLVEGHV